MITRVSNVVDEDAVRIESICVGNARQSLPTPDLFVTLLEAGRPFLRVDVHSYECDAFVFQEAIVWHGLLLIGYGGHVHAIALADRSVRTLDLRSYFGRFYPTPDYLLIASGERLFRMGPDRSIRWTSEVLGLDGVIVHEASTAIIQGDGEWDPPGGWRPFAVSALDGTSVST